MGTHWTDLDGASAGLWKVVDLLGSLASSSEAASSTEAVESSVSSGGGDGVLGGRRRRLRHRGAHGAPRGAGEGTCSTLCIRCGPNHSPCALHPGMPQAYKSLTYRARKLCFPGSCPGVFSILVRKLACPKVGMSGNLYPRRGLQPVFWIRRLTNASSASSPVREFVFLQIPVRMPGNFHVRLLRRGIPCVWGSVVREFIRSGWLEYTTDI